MDNNSNGQQSPSTDDKNKPSVLGNIWAGIQNGLSSITTKVTGVVSSPSSSAEENPNPPTGGKGRKHKKSMKGGKSRKHTSSKARKGKGKGKKRTYGRK
jgi:hypothetical protein